MVAVLLLVFGLTDSWIGVLRSPVLTALGVGLVLVSGFYLYLAWTAD